MLTMENNSNTSAVDQTAIYTSGSAASVSALPGALDAPTSSMAARCANLPRRRLDPRVSLVVVLLLNITAFMYTSILLEFAALGGCVVLACLCSRAVSALRWLIAYGALFVLGVLCVVVGGPLVPFGVSMLMIRRILCVGMFASIMIATTRTGEFACALQRIKAPRKVVCALCVMLRFFPMLGQEFRMVLDAMKLRGVFPSPARLVRHPAQTIEHLMVPTIARVGIVADELADAAVVRGIDSDSARTSYFELAMRPCDAIFAAYFVALALAALAMRLGVFA